MTHLVGLVYYTDTGEVFRVVYPTDDDAELDDPQWTIVGVDPDRPCKLVKIDQTRMPTFPGFGADLDRLVD